MHRRIVFIVFTRWSAFPHRRCTAWRLQRAHRTGLWWHPPVATGCVGAELWSLQGVLSCQNVTMFVRIYVWTSLIRYKGLEPLFPNFQNRCMLLACCKLPFPTIRGPCLGATTTCSFSRPPRFADNQEYFQVFLTKASNELSWRPEFHHEPWEFHWAVGSNSSKKKLTCVRPKTEVLEAFMEETAGKAEQSTLLT